MYANEPGWDVARDGGALRAELAAAPGGGGGEGREGRSGGGGGGGGATVVEVAPAGGTLVVFDARRIWHEVLPARRLRFAITLWVHADLGPGRSQPRPLTAKAVEPLVALETDCNGRTAYVWQEV